MTLSAGNVVVHSGFSVFNALTNNEITKTNATDVWIAEPEPFSVLAYPNPSATEFSLVIKNGSNEKVQVVVYDENGKPIRTLEGNTGKQQIRFGADLRPGIYMAEVIQGNKRQAIKLVKH